MVNIFFIYILYSLFVINLLELGNLNIIWNFRNYKYYKYEFRLKHDQFPKPTHLIGRGKCVWSGNNLSGRQIKAEAQGHMGGSWTRFCFLDGPTSCAILLLAYSIRMGPRSDDSRNEACRAAMTRAALPTSRYSTKTTGDPPPVAPAAAPAAGAPLLVVCMRSRQKPGKLCNKNTTRVHCTASCSRWWWLWWWFVG